MRDFNASFCESFIYLLHRLAAQADISSIALTKISNPRQGLSQRPREKCCGLQRTSKKQAKSSIKDVMLLQGEAYLMGAETAQVELPFLEESRHQP